MKINDIITRDGKKYKVVSVLEELQQKGISSCALCDYRSHISVCEFGINNMCLPNHCYKLVKEDNTIMDNKGKCPRCGSESFATERRPNGDSVCSKCNFSGKTTEFYSKHKLSDLCFKVITGSIKRNETIAGLFMKITKQDIIVNSHATYLLIIASKMCCSYDNIDNSNTAIKEITFEEAVKLLESCEVETPETKESSGRFVEYDINEHGVYTLISNKRHVLPWYNYSRIETTKRIFAGWLWEHPEDSIDDGWSLNRQGINRTTRSMTSICEDWEYPLVPTKIRFWVKD